MGNFNKKIVFYTEDPSGQNDRKESFIEIKYSSVSDAGEIIIKDGYMGESNVFLDEQGFNCLMDLLSELENYTKFYRYKNEKR